MSSPACQFMPRVTITQYDPRMFECVRVRVCVWCTLYPRNSKILEDPKIRVTDGPTDVQIDLQVDELTDPLIVIKKQGRIHDIRCYETPFSAVAEKPLRIYGRTD